MSLVVLQHRTHDQQWLGGTSLTRRLCSQLGSSTLPLFLGYRSGSRKPGRRSHRYGEPLSRMLLSLGRFPLLHLRKQGLPRARNKTQRSCCAKGRLSVFLIPVGHVISQKLATLQSWLWGFCVNLGRQTFRTKYVRSSYEAGAFKVQVSRHEATDTSEYSEKGYYGKRQQ